MTVMMRITKNTNDEYVNDGDDALEENDDKMLVK